VHVTVVAALRRAFAALVLFAAALAALVAALFEVWHPYWGSATGPPVNFRVNCSIADACYSTRPGWAIPLAVAIGLIGILVAALLYRPRSTAAILRRDARAGTHP
jgi:hypothetical protein